MRRSTAIAVVFVVAAACSSSKGAGPSATTSTSTSTTTTSLLASGSGSTTSTSVEPTTLGGSEGFHTRTPGTLVVGTERLAAPWYLGVTPDTVTGGFEYDLARELALRLGVPAVKVVSSSLVVLMTNQDCKCDVMISGITITDGRARTLDLSEPYLVADQGVLVRTGATIATATDAASLRWAVAVHNTTGQDVIKTRIKPALAPALVVNEDEALRGLADGSLDALMLDTPDALSIALADPRFVVAGQFRTGELDAIALSLGSPNTAIINDVIRDMRNDGTIDRLLRLYLGIEPANVRSIPP